MKKIYLVALALLFSSSVVLGQDTQNTSSEDETTTQTAPASTPAIATESTSEEDMYGGAPVDGVYVDENNVGVTFIYLQFVRQADVLFSKKVQQEIDLAEKMNRPLNHPNARLITCLIEAMKKGELTGYANPEDGTDSTFRTPLDSTMIAKVTGGRTDTIQVPDPYDPYIMRDTVVTEMFNPDLISKYRIKEEWFFDKRRGVFEPRIIGIAPCKLNISKSTGDTLGSTPMFWVYYPDARQVLSNSLMFNRFNDSANTNFDDFFIRRMFSSYVIKESNSDDIRIADYKVGINRLYESEKIKKKLMDYEQDLWEY